MSLIPSKVKGANENKTKHLLQCEIENKLHLLNGTKTIVSIVCTKFSFVRLTIRQSNKF